MTEEYGLISCLLNKPDLLSRIQPKITEDYFEETRCKIIYAKMIELGSFSIPLLAKELTGNVDFKTLLKISELIPLVTISGLEQYCFVVVERYKQRKIEQVLKSKDYENIPDKINEITKISFFDEEKVDESKEFLESVEQRFKGEKDHRCIETGFLGVDSLINGFRKSELVIIGGRPASGKTTFAMNMAYNMAKNQYKVLFCSLEMGSVELHERLNKSITKINNYCEMTPADFERITKVSLAIKEKLSLEVFDKAGMTIEDIIFKSKTLKKENKLDAVFVDHLSILKTLKPFKSRYEEISFLSARLKILARELDIPIVCLCQLNRALESREIKSPTMADLRDSGSIEQDADLIGFVYRPEHHLKDREPDDITSIEYSKWEEEMKQVRGKAQFIIAKNRRGSTGKVKFIFDGSNYSFFERED